MTKSYDPANPIGDFRMVEPMNGLTKREYFAGIAMQGFLAQLQPMPPSQILDVPKNTASWAVACADALIEQLNKQS